METEESKELTLAQEETIKKTLEEIRKHLIYGLYRGDF